MKNKLSPQEQFWLRNIMQVYIDIMPRLVRNQKNFVLSRPIIREAVDRFLRYKDLIEESNPGMKGSDPYKEAGYLSYWIAKFKPIQILEPDPAIDEVLVNEYLAIYFAISYFYESKNVSILSKKLVNDLKYLLRNRTLTVRILPIIYEAYVVGFHEGIAQHEKALENSLKNRGIIA